MALQTGSGPEPSVCRTEAQAPGSAQAETMSSVSLDRRLLADALIQREKDPLRCRVQQQDKELSLIWSI